MKKVSVSKFYKLKSFGNYFVCYKFCLLSELYKNKSEKISVKSYLPDFVSIFLTISK